MYNLIVESIAGNIDTEKPLPFLEETCEDIALFYNANSTKIEEMVLFMVSEGLLEVETTEKRISCYKIYGYLEQSQTRSEKIRELIAAYKHKRNILEGQKCFGLSETKVIEKTKKRKDEDKTDIKELEQFSIFYQSYPKKVGKTDAIKKFRSLIKEGVTLDTILSKLDVYKKQLLENKTEMKYVRGSARFLSTLDDFEIPEPLPKPEKKILLCPECGVELRFGVCPSCLKSSEETNEAL